MNQKAKDYIESNTLDLESNNRMDTTGYVQYAVSASKAYGAIVIAKEEMKQKAIEAYKNICSFSPPGCCGCKNANGECDCEELKNFIEKLNS